MINKPSLKQPSERMKYNELRHKYYLLKDLMDFIPDVIYFKDRKGKFIMVNQAHAKGLGVKPEALIGKTDFDLFPRDRAEQMAQDDNKVMNTGQPIIDKVERATRPDGVDNYVSTTKIPRFDSRGKVIGLIGITRDITRRMQFERLRKDKINIEKKLESLEELSAMKSEFVSTVSHELRTPLAVIKQLILIILDEVAGKLNRKQKEVLSKALNNAERLKKIIDDLLDISRIERKALKLHYSLVDLTELVKDSSGFFIKLAEEKNITLKYFYPKDPVNVFIDADRITQVINNLITNAIKFTDNGGKIRVEIVLLEAKVRIGVIDNGIGISKADLPVVFDKFTQVSKIDSVENKGVGLGLTIAKHLIERHRGEIWVESKVGIGSKFYFTLPRFYTLDMLSRSIKDKISSLMHNGVPLHFVSVLILNYNEFRQRIKAKDELLFKDLQAILNQVLKETKHGSLDKRIIAVIDPKLGKLSIILTHVTEKQVGIISGLLRYKITQYFVKNKIHDVFISIGTLSYSHKTLAEDENNLPSRFSINEIYIGSEMRRFKRVPLKTSVKLFLGSGKFELCDAVDISEGGICLITKSLLKTDALLRISFSFPQNKENIIQARARVAWLKKMERLSAEESDKYKVGFEFMGLEKKYKKAIKDILQAKKKRGLNYD